jgi:hypothetical protein
MQLGADTELTKLWTKMSRFQIEDIVEQDKHGVVFRARDEESGRIVSLHRFLPFGQDGGGLEKEEAVAFEIASERLAEISHVALRSVITGSVDPIDGIPYLVTEWVDGMSLNEVLAGESMDPALVIDVLRIALEVSIVLSHVLGEEAVWVETEVESIIIGTKDSGRGFTFLISPFKWLGAQFESRKLSSIVELGEELTGWNRKLVRDSAGYGLGGWLKWLKKNPGAGLGEALEKLASSTGNEPPPPESELIERATNTQALRIAPAYKRKPVMIAAAGLLLLVFAALFYLLKTAKHPQIAAIHSEKEIKNTVLARSSQKSARPLSAAERRSARAAELKLEAAKVSASSAASKDPKKPAPAKPTLAKTPDESGKIFSADDKKLWDDKKTGTPVKLGGILRKVTISGKGNSIYLLFSDPADHGKLAGVAHKKSFKGDFREETFMPWVGKNLVLTGTCFKEPRGRILVKIPDEGKIEVVK